MSAERRHARHAAADRARKARQERMLSWAIPASVVVLAAVVAVVLTATGGSDGPPAPGSSGELALGEEVYEGTDPLALPAGPEPFRLEREGSDAELVLALPLTSRSEVDLARHADDLIVTVGAYRRVLTLPTSLRGAEVAGAKLRDGSLRVRLRVTEAAR